MYRKHTARVIYRLVLAHEDDRNSLCELAQDSFGGVDVMPYACVG